MADEQTYLVFAWTTSGYELREQHGTLPEVGTEVGDDGRSGRVVKIGPSPLPHDDRACVYVQG